MWLLGVLFVGVFFVFGILGWLGFCFVGSVGFELLVFFLFVWVFWVGLLLFGAV